VPEQVNELNQNTSSTPTKNTTNPKSNPRVKKEKEKKVPRAELKVAETVTLT